jgi:hypothetical protein
MRPVVLEPLGPLLPTARRRACWSVFITSLVWGMRIGGCVGGLVGAVYVIVGAVFGAPIGAAVGFVIAGPVSLVVVGVCVVFGKPGAVDRLQAALAQLFIALVLALAAPVAIPLARVSLDGDRSSSGIDPAVGLWFALVLLAAFVAWLLGLANRAITRAWYRPFGWIEAPPQAGAAAATPTRWCRGACS